VTISIPSEWVRQQQVTGTGQALDAFSRVSLAHVRNRDFRVCLLDRNGWVYQFVRVGNQKIEYRAGGTSFTTDDNNFHEFAPNETISFEVSAPLDATKVRYGFRFKSPHASFWGKTWVIWSDWAEISTKD